MGKREEFLEILIHRTHESEIKWSIGNITPISKYIVNSDMVSQVFNSTINGAELYFVIQKAISFNQDSGIPYEEFTNFINVISGRDLVDTIYENEASRLDKLLEEIRISIAGSFYDSFM